MNKYDFELAARELSDLRTAVTAALGGPTAAPGGALIALVPGFRAHDPEGAARQRIDAGTYPFPVRILAGRRVVLATDVANTFYSLAHSGVATEHRVRALKIRDKGGRPPKFTAYPTTATLQPHTTDNCTKQHGGSYVQEA